MSQATGFPRDCLFADPENALYDALGLYRGLGVTFLSVATPFAIKKRMDEARTGDLQDILPRWQPWIPPKLEQVGGGAEQQGAEGPGPGAGEGEGAGEGGGGGGGEGEGREGRGGRGGRGKGSKWQQRRVAAGVRASRRVLRRPQPSHKSHGTYSRRLQTAEPSPALGSSPRQTLGCPSPPLAV